ncbi:MAG TPA: hypothetical protein VKH41_10600 [Myxococcota bacterium]|nr:hypothetical protein [Myxococcota bacterium]
MRIRPLVALAALLVCASKSAHATSPVQTARAEEPAAAVAFDDSSTSAPVSPLAVAATLGATGDLAAGSPTEGSTLQIQLGAADRVQRGSAILDRSYDVNPLDM